MCLHVFMDFSGLRIQDTFQVDIYLQESPSTETLPFFKACSNMEIWSSNRQPGRLHSKPAASPRDLPIDLPAK